VIETITFYPNGIWSAGYAEASEPSVVTQNYESSGGETTGPAYDLVDARRNTQITIDTSGETTDFQFDIDLSANITGMDFMILDNHNFADTNSYVSFRYGAGNTGMTPSSAYSGSLEEVLNVNAIPYFEFEYNELGLILFSAVTSANFNLYVEDQIVDPFAADVELGQWFIGKSFTPAHAPDQPTEISNFRGVNLHTSLGGQKVSKKRYGERRAWNLKWSYLTSSDMESFLTVWQTTEGPRFPFYIDLGEAATPQLYFVRFVDGSLSIKKLAASAYELSFTIESEV